MHKGMRLLLATTAALISAPVFAWLAAELATLYYTLSTGVYTQAELGDDLGFGVLLFMVIPPITLIGSLFVWCFVWSRSGPKNRADPNGNTHA
jgi:hypothetical protein